MTLSRRQSLHLFAGALSGPVLAALPAAAQGPSGGAPPRRGGTLTQVTQGEPTTLVPLLDSNTNTRNISGKVIEGLLRFDRDFQPQPLLATQWSVSPDGLAYTFKLREGVTWHDGRPFTAADVRFSLLALKKVGPRGRITFANLQAVETPDPHTAVLVLSKPTPYLLKALASAESPIVAAHTYPTDTWAESPNGARPIGTGPYIFEEWKRGSHVLLRRNPDYWRPQRPYLDRIVVRFVGDTAAASTALETGEADVATSVALHDLERLKASPRLAVDSTRDAYLNNSQVFEFNLDTPVLARREVRHALAHAIDRRFIVEAIYYGQTEPSGSPIPAALKAYNDEAPFDYPFDPAKANQLLDAAGLPRGADGSRFALRLTYIPGDPFKRTAEYLRSAFGKVGVKVSVLDGDLATFIKRVYCDRGFDINLNGISRLFDPTAGVQRLYWSDGIRNPLPYLNAAHYDNPRVDALFRAAATEADEARRIAQFKEIQAITGADLPVFGVVLVPTIVARSRRVEGLFNSVDLTAGDYADAWLSG